MTEGRLDYIRELKIEGTGCMHNLKRGPNCALAQSCSLPSACNGNTVMITFKNRKIPNKKPKVREDFNLPMLQAFLVLGCAI